MIGELLGCVSENEERIMYEDSSKECQGRDRAIKKHG